MALAAELINVCLVPVIKLERIEVRVVELAGIDHLSNEDIFLKEIRMHRPERLFLFNVLERLVRERHFGFLQIRGSLFILCIQCSITPFLPLVETIHLLRMEPAKDAIGMSSLFGTFAGISQMQSLIIHSQRGVMFSSGIHCSAWKVGQIVHT